MWFLKRKEKNESTSSEAEDQKTKRKPRQKKQEKLKPWGNKERAIVFGTLGVSLIGSALLAVTARNWKLPGLPRISVKLPKEGFEETFILNSRSKRAKSEMIDNFKEATRDLSGVYGFHFLSLSSGVEQGYLSDEEFQAASLIKLPVMAKMFEEAESGRLDLETKHTLTEAEKVGGSGSLFYEPAGTVVTLRELMELMGQKSDNTAFNIALGILGESEVGKYIYEIGMRNTSLQENVTTPKDISIFFKKLWEGRLVSKQSRDEMLEYLTDTIYEDWLPAGVPEDLKVSHKYGREIHIVNDAGIVFTDKPYVVVIMSKGVVETVADNVFPELSKIIFKHSN